MTPERALSSYRESLKIAQVEGDTEAVVDLLYRIELMQHFPNYTFDLNRLICQSTHGDYFISQLLWWLEKNGRSFVEKLALVQEITEFFLPRDLVFTTPTYCMRASAPMKSFIDLTFINWMPHRPKKTMFHKKAVVISTATGAGYRLGRDI